MCVGTRMQTLESSRKIGKECHDATDDLQCNNANILDILNRPEPAKICAPMVRYSKLGFRTLVRKYGCDIAYTPMIVADSFLQSESCRNIEFQTNTLDKPLIVQFGAKDAKEFADATLLVSPYVSGVGLNCGCPQRWAVSAGYGAKLLKDPVTLKDYIKFARAQVPSKDFTISAKIRIDSDYKKSVDLCRQLEQTGVSFISVHGRTPSERGEPVHYDAIKLIKDSLSVPVVANGDVTSLQSLKKVHDLTGADGIMVARGLLNNPAMFQGYANTPIKCVKDWVEISMAMGTHFTCFHNHLIYMLEKLSTKADKRLFNTLQSTPAVLEYLDKFFNANTSSK